MTGADKVAAARVASEIEAIADDMLLPSGMRCTNCMYFDRCVKLIGASHINEAQTRCDWSPSRFRRNYAKDYAELERLATAVAGRLEKLAGEMDVFRREGLRPDEWLLKEWSDQARKVLAAFSARQR